MIRKIKQEGKKGVGRGEALWFRKATLRREQLNLNEGMEGAPDIWWASTWRNSKRKGPEAGAIIPQG